MQAYLISRRAIEIFSYRVFEKMSYVVDQPVLLVTDDSHWVVHSDLQTGQNKHRQSGNIKLHQESPELQQSLQKGKTLIAVLYVNLTSYHTLLSEFRTKTTACSPASWVSIGLHFLDIQCNALHVFVLSSRMLFSIHQGKKKRCIILEKQKENHLARPSGILV